MNISMLLDGLLSAICLVYGLYSLWTNNFSTGLICIVLSNILLNTAQIKEKQND